MNVVQDHLLAWEREWVISGLLFYFAPTARECHPDHGAEELLLPVLPPSGDPTSLHVPPHHFSYSGGLSELPGARTQRGKPFFLRYGD